MSTLQSGTLLESTQTMSQDHETDSLGQYVAHMLAIHRQVIAV